MKTTPEVAELLHELMLYDLVASEVYHVQSVLLADWGYDELAAHFEHESLHEREHADRQLERLAYLGVEIDLSKRPTGAKVGNTPRACIEESLRMEMSVAAKLRELCARCTNHDEGTRLLAEELLEETETDHIWWLEQQLGHMDRIGEQKYLAEMIHDRGTFSTESATAST